MNVPYSSSVVSGGIGKPTLLFQLKRNDRIIQSKKRIYLRVQIANDKNVIYLYYDIKKQNKRNLS